MQLRDAVEHRLSLNDSAVRVVTAGAGKPAVLFDAALGTPLEAWSLVAPAIAERTRVILWDRPGVGRSGPAVALDAQAMGDAMASVIAQAGGGPVVAVGHSRGGINVLALAVCHPELISGLVLVESSHPDQMNRMPIADGPLLAAVHVLARVPSPVVQLPALAARGLVRFAGERARPGTRALAELAPAVSRRLGGVAAEHDAGPALLADVGDKLAQRGLPNVPLIVLTGDDNFPDPADQATWSSMHAELATLSERGKQVHVPCGHEMPFSNPDAVIDAIGDVLAEVSHPER